MSDQRNDEDEGVVLTEAQKRARRSRSIAVTVAPTANLEERGVIDFLLSDLGVQG